MTLPASSPSATALFRQFTALAQESGSHPPSPSDAGQSLAAGAAGRALLFVERAWHDRSWCRAHQLIGEAAAGEINAGDTGGLFLGATAVAFLLSTTPPGRDHLYADARTALHHRVTALAHRRADAAHQRLRCGLPLAFADYDLFYGLTGIGAYLLRTDPGSSALGHVLEYLVALTQPHTLHGSDRPGWWVRHDPLRTHSDRFPGGHANLGTAHGIAGPLLLLAKALRAGNEVAGHRTANASSATSWAPGARKPPKAPGGPPTCLMTTFGHAALGRKVPAGRAGATAPPASPVPDNSLESPSMTPASKPSTRTPCTGH